VPEQGTVHPLRIMSGRPTRTRRAFNTGTPPEEVARRLVHGVEVLRKVYAECEP
jgi:hypothetical protein